MWYRAIIFFYFYNDQIVQVTIQVSHPRKEKALYGKKYTDRI